MRRSRVLALLALGAALLSQSGAGAAAPATDFTFSLTSGQSASWTGVPANGANLNYHGVVPSSSVPGKYQCSKTDATHKCEQIFLTLSNPLTAEEIANEETKTRAFSITVGQYSPGAPVTDVDLVVWQTDANGTKLTPTKPTYTSGCMCAPVANAGYSTVVFDEKVDGSVTSSAGEQTFHFLIDIPYFTAVNSSYKGNITF